MKKMFLKLLGGKIVGLFLILICVSSATNPTLGAVFNDPPAIHGMLMVGTQTIFLSHLPMFHRPHDYQVILEVGLQAASSNPQMDRSRKA